MKEDGDIELDEEAPLPENFQSLMDDVDLEDFDLNQITNHSHENGFLTLSCELKHGEIVPVPFGQTRHDCPHQTAKCIKEKVVGLSRRDFHQQWVMKLLSQRRMSVRRLNRAHRVENAHRIHIRRTKEGKGGTSKSRNSRVLSQAMREQFGIKVPNSTKEALLLDMMSGDSKWHDAI